MQIEGSYLVRNDSPLRANQEVDRDGIRVAVGNKSAYDLFLTRELKKAKIERAPVSPAVVDYFIANKLDVAAGVKRAGSIACRRRTLWRYPGPGIGAPPCRVACVFCLPRRIDDS